MGGYEPSGLTRFVRLAALTFLARLYKQADRWLEPRLLALSGSSAPLWWAVWICLLRAIILLAIPPGNLLPSFSSVVLSLAWILK